MKSHLLHFELFYNHHPRRITILIISMIIGLTSMFVFSRRSHTDIDAIAVSNSEEYIAFFETGEEYKIHCYKYDGTFMFDYNITSDLSAGGYCTMWFDGEILCVLFYRTHMIAYFSLKGEILSIAENVANEAPTAFSNFIRKGNRYIYTGNDISVIYEKQSFLEYWLLGEERYLSIAYNMKKIVVKSW